MRGADWRPNSKQQQVIRDKAEVISDKVLPEPGQARLGGDLPRIDNTPASLATFETPDKPRIDNNLSVQTEIIQQGILEIRNLGKL